MKEVFAITEKSQEGRTRPNHVLFGINKDDLRSATRFTDARLKINWNTDFVWGLLCEDETYEFIKKNQMFSGFDPYENEVHTEIFLRLMTDMHFYKEVQMI
jgi:hypothetical protein